jgi:hypothetical protein
MIEVKEVVYEAGDKWEQLGDVNFLEWDGTFIQPVEGFPRTYRVITVINLQHATGGDGYLFEEVEVDLTDSWIDWESVGNFAGGYGHGNYGDYEGEETYYQQVQDVIAYYGAENFGGTTEEVIEGTHNECTTAVIDRLAEYGIFVKCK